MPEGDAAREPLGDASGERLRRILGRPAREVSVSLPLPLVAGRRDLAVSARTC